MRVFVTGGSGHIGSALVHELLDAGHEVVALARSERAAIALVQAGASIVCGDIGDAAVLAQAASDADGVIHLAFNHEQMRSGEFATAAATDLRAVKAMGAALAGSDRPFVSTSGTLMLAFAGIEGRLATERDVSEGGHRVDSENAVAALAESGVRSSVVRLSPLVHSSLDHHGFAPSLITIARQHGFAGYLRDGSNRWPAVHTLDAARLYRLALESAPAGSRLHGVADEAVPFKAIAEAIGRNLDVPVRSVDAQDAEAYFTFLSGFVGLDNPTSNEVTRGVLGWEPTRPGLIEDLDDGHYFADPA